MSYWRLSCLSLWSFCASGTTLSCFDSAALLLLFVDWFLVGLLAFNFFETSIRNSLVHAIELTYAQKVSINCEQHLRNPWFSSAAHYSIAGTLGFYCSFPLCFCMYDGAPHIWLFPTDTRRACCCSSVLKLKPHQAPVPSDHFCIATFTLPPKIIPLKHGGQLPKPDCIH